MAIIPTEGNEPEITRAAIEAGLTYYDASYMYTAKTLVLTLVTEDKRLRDATKKIGAHTANLAELA